MVAVNPITRNSSGRNSSLSRGQVCQVVLIVFLVNLLSQLFLFHSSSSLASSSNEISQLIQEHLSSSATLFANTEQQQGSSSSSKSSTTSTTTTTATTDSTQLQLKINPLSIPQGQAPNLPSLRTADADSLRGHNKTVTYGGKGDGKHLGGFTNIDLHGISPAVWKFMVEQWYVRSVLDVGCGRGISTSWFATHGLRTQCVEGSHDAIEQSMVPDNKNNNNILVEHDFSRGPWWPGETFDVVWSVEFLEHVNLQFQFNYVSAFRKAGILMVTSSFVGGWHHVEVHETDWWVQKYEAYGFRYSEKLTNAVRRVASEERSANLLFGPTPGKTLNAQHVWTSMKIFLNPTVLALPEHAHLFGEHGCFVEMNQPKRPCGSGTHEQAKIETKLDPKFWPLNLTKAQDDEWERIVKEHTTTTTTTQ
mmetsp:Transcript_27348/g.41384  ORF Transcript_27348/g.41384 Transcript_27348/m.41384 type:complete len:420 (-) Transcript_27348:51-1310(-)|eukprot:CAMPEP_0178910700 /NCGR_PEP_ID=MMETSP0786-20121207/9241_1 /TAXON_ID=186022 /ORGANISM="Thalassionema frauenfeldii, Strain CCMP 1798" /LENGTH=419 /DNA_ID=CAMNT_0020582977 /DNA_START=85 /DNA_END=1344 /DNA_ORIENTATION=+